MKRIYAENYNSPALVDMWSDFIGWRKRRKGEQGFLPRVLREHGCKKIIDGCLGDGCDSIYLLKQGFDVSSNEIDSLFVEKALLNARKARVNLSLTNYDWRDFGEKFAENTFDAILLLGNDLTYLFSEQDRKRVLTAFRNTLRPGGILLIDERNYDYILSNRTEILRGNFRYSGKYVYCGKRVHARPVEITANKVVMKYVRENGNTAFLSLYPFKKGEMRGLLEGAGFNKIQQYSDYSNGYNPESDFHEYLAVK